MINTSNMQARPERKLQNWAGAVMVTRCPSDQVKGPSSSTLNRAGENQVTPLLKYMLKLSIPTSLIDNLLLVFRYLGEWKA